MKNKIATVNFTFRAITRIFIGLFFLLASCEASERVSIQDVPIPEHTTLEISVNEETPQVQEKSGTTPGPDRGFNCSSVNKISPVECEALVALYDSTNGPDWSESSGWMNSEDPCTWSGITCERDHVSHINLSSNQLKGTLPPELAELTRLRSLVLFNNQLDGEVPVELANLDYLQDISLAYNQFVGTIPSFLSEIESLDTLDLSHNQFIGPIPPKLGNLVNLTHLYLSHNRLDSSIPTTFSNLDKLIELDLTYNRFVGSVPESVTHIDQLSLWGNQLDGSITTEDQVDFSADYTGVHFSADSSLADSIWPEVKRASTLPEVLEGPSYWLAIPDHIRFTLADRDLPTFRQRMGINLEAEAQILIFSLDDLLDINPLVQAQIESLQSRMADRAVVPSSELPLIPLNNAFQVFHAQEKYLDSEAIHGLRFITQYTQDNIPAINNRDMFYTFQGLSKDGACYISIFFPLTTAVLPDKVELEDRYFTLDNYEKYVVETKALLEQLPSSEFMPDLTLLDALVASIRLDPNVGYCGTKP